MEGSATSDQSLLMSQYPPDTVAARSSSSGMDSSPPPSLDDPNIDNSSGTTPSTQEQEQQEQDRILSQFIRLALCFSANHGCVVACLSLATARLGSTVGAWSSGVLYATYSISGVAGSTFVSKQVGSRNAMAIGMAMYCAYVAAFWMAAVVEEDSEKAAVAVGVGSVLGGTGAGFLWTAQGSYFGAAAERHASAAAGGGGGGGTVEDSTSKLAGIFAFIYLTLEVGLRALSTILLKTLNVPWSTIFGIYATVAIVSTCCMITVDPLTTPDGTTTASSQAATASAWYKITAAAQLLRNDPKMKYMVGVNAIFGLTSAFLTSYVNGQVVRVVLDDDRDSYVGVLSAWVSCVAAAMSLVFGRIAPSTGKGPILVTGSVCFLGVAMAFLLWPSVERDWHWMALVGVYALHGTGRATFEGTLKALFADYFSYEKEGAFANIILQNGLSSALGFVLSFRLLCSNEKRQLFGPYCVEYTNGSVHDVLSFELLIVGAAVSSIFGLWRASSIRQNETARGTYENLSTAVIENDTTEEVAGTIE